MRKSIFCVICMITMITAFGCSGRMKIYKEAIPVTGLENAYSRGEGALIKSKMVKGFYYQIVADYVAPQTVRDKLTAKQKQNLPLENIPLEELSKKTFVSQAKSGLIRAWLTETTEAAGGVPVFGYSQKTEGHNKCYTNIVAVRITPLTLYSSPDVQINFSLTHEKDDTVLLSTANTIVTKATELYTAMGPTAANAINKVWAEIHSLVLPNFKSSEKTDNDLVLLWKSDKTPTLVAYLPLVYEDSDEKEYLAGFISFHVRAKSTLFETNTNAASGLPDFKDRTVNIIPATITDRNTTKLTQKIHEYSQKFKRDETDKEYEISNMERDLKIYNLSDYDLAFCMYLALSASDNFDVVVEDTLPGAFGNRYANLVRACGVEIKNKNQLIKKSRYDAEIAIGTAGDDVRKLNEILSGYITGHNAEYTTRKEFVSNLYAVLSKIKLFNRVEEYTYFDSTRDYWEELIQQRMKTKIKFLQERNAKIKGSFAPTVTFIKRFLNKLKTSQEDREDALAGEYFDNQVYANSYIKKIGLPSALTPKNGIELAKALSTLRIQSYGCIYGTGYEGYISGTKQTIGQVYGKSDYRGMSCAKALVKNEKTDIKIFFNTVLKDNNLRISGLTIMRADQLDASNLLCIDPGATEECRSVLTGFSDKTATASGETAAQEGAPFTQ